MTGRGSYHLPRGHEFHFYTLIARFTKAEQYAFNVFFPSQIDLAPFFI